MILQSEAYGFGIEKYFISALYNGYDTNSGDDVGEGVCQHLSLIDQLKYVYSLWVDCVQKY